jgi:hypothetical protein
MLKTFTQVLHVEKYIIEVNFFFVFQISHQISIEMLRVNSPSSSNTRYRPMRAENQSANEVEYARTSSLEFGNEVKNFDFSTSCDLSAR